MPFDITKTDSGLMLTPRLATDFEERLVAFIDILGFTDLVRRSMKDELARTVLRNLMLTLERECGLDTTIGTGIPLSYSHGSDSIIISCPVQRQTASVLFMRLQLLQAHLLGMYGLLCRGGLTVGPMIHAANVFYGPAYLDALELEKRAVMPMIAVSEPLMELLKTWPECSARVRRDNRGVPFIDYFWTTADGQGVQASGFQQQRAQIERLRSSDANANERVRAKYDWIVRYFNEAIGRAATLEVPPLEAGAEP